MELIGHSSISLTMNTYGHVLEEMKRETARQTDAVLERLVVKEGLFIKDGGTPVPVADKTSLRRVF